MPRRTKTTWVDDIVHAMRSGKPTPTSIICQRVKQRRLAAGRSWPASKENGVGAQLSKQPDLFKNVEYGVWQLRA
jgi:hypothetical protein